MRKITKFVILLPLVFLSLKSYAAEESKASSGEESHFAPPKKRLRTPGVEDLLAVETDVLNFYEKQRGILPVTDVARIFLMLDKKETGEFPHIDKLKLHKLCYYAQGYCLALLNQPLFDEPTYAYKHGPFYGDPLETVYPECIVGHKSSLVLKKDLKLEDYNSTIVQFLEVIYKMKKSLTGIDLRKASHKEVPWLLTYKDGMWKVINRGVLKGFFSAASQIAPLIKKGIEDSSLDQFILQMLRTKQLLKRNHNIQEIIGFNDDLLDVIGTRPIKPEELGGVSSHITELIDWKQESPNHAVAGFLFFPSELIEDHTPLATLFLNLPLHWKLAYSVRYGHPVAQLFFSKLLKHFEILADKSAQFLEKAKSQFEKVSTDAPISPYLQGLALKYLDREADARSCFEEGERAGNSFSTYERAKIMDKNGEDGVFEAYKKSFDAGCSLGALGMGYYGETDLARFQAFKEAGENGIGEGYYQIGKMIREGFTAPGDNLVDAWFVRAGEAGSVNALLSLAKSAEVANDDVEAVKYYRALAKMGNLNGFLGHGRILENNGLYDDAKKIYENAGWMGLYEIARLTPSREDDIKDQAARQFEKHFKDLVEIAEGKDVDEE